VTYRGLSPRTRTLRWSLLAIAIGLAFGVAFPLAVQALLALLATAPERLAWVGTRVFAFMGYFAMAGSVIYGLLLSTKILDRIAHRPVTYTLHKDLALAGLGFIMVHVLLLTVDATMPFSLAQLVVPFSAPYRPLWVGIGQLTLYLTAIVVGSFYVRRQIGQRTWRMLHYFTFLAFLGSTLHGIFSGTDAGAAWAWWAYTVPLVAVVFLLTYRIIDAAYAGEARQTAAEAATAAAMRGGVRPFPAGPNVGVPAPRPVGPLDLRAPQPRRAPQQPQQQQRVARG
jgi:methionine sulfoxide reductase heme-binding subunit